MNSEKRSFTSFDGVVWSDEFQEWVVALFKMADVDGSGTVNDGDELAMLLSYLNLEPSEACADKLNQMLEGEDGAKHVQIPANRGHSGTSLRRPPLRTLLS